MKAEIEFLKKKYPEALVWESLDSDYINVRFFNGVSNFYNDKNEKFTVNVSNTEKYHIDSVRFECKSKD